MDAAADCSSSGDRRRAEDASSSLPDSGDSESRADEWRATGEDEEGRSEAEGEACEGRELPSRGEKTSFFANCGDNPSACGDRRPSSAL